MELTCTHVCEESREILAEPAQRGAEAPIAPFAHAIYNAVPGGPLESVPTDTGRADVLAGAAQTGAEVALAPPGHAIYKGLVGNLLEGVPMDADRRIELQRASAAISAPFTGRSLALLLGLGNPVLFIAGGMIWGIWAASQIGPPASGAAAPMLDGQMPAGLHSAHVSD